MLTQLLAWALIATLPLTLAQLDQLLGPAAQTTLRVAILSLLLPTIVAVTLFPHAVAIWLGAQPLRITHIHTIHSAWIILFAITLWTW